MPNEQCLSYFSFRTQFGEEVTVYRKQFIVFQQGNVKVEWDGDSLSIYISHASGGCSAYHHKKIDENKWDKTRCIKKYSDILVDRVWARISRSIYASFGVLDLTDVCDEEIQKLFKEKGVSDE